MELNFVGLAAALATFFGVWWGHVSVRKIERETVNIWIPTVVAVVLGMGLWIASTLTSSLPLSAASGILGVTLLWDALEIAIRQPKRIKHGHAPANPNNPRHVKILAEYPAATTIDLLDRDPIGRAYTAQEVTALKEGAK
ncbi:MAG: DUF4491 family protein [Chloroflexota bacterium]|jgi:Domain of unknown function (DUF4491)